MKTLKLNSKKRIKYSGGFTLVETLVAITILLIAVTAAFSAAQMGLSSSIFANQQITAFYLSQDAIEYIREIRDHNSPLTWLYGDVGDLSPCIQAEPSFPVKCRLDSSRAPADSGAIVSCDANGCENMKFDDLSGNYNYETGTDTSFNRSVTIIPLNDGNEAQVSVTVSWMARGYKKSFSVRENIMNWR